MFFHESRGIIEKTIFLNKYKIKIEPEIWFFNEIVDKIVEFSTCKNEFLTK